MAPMAPPKYVHESSSYVTLGCW